MLGDIEAEAPADPPIDPTAYSNQDVIGTLRSLAPWWQLLLVGLDPLVATRAPAGGPSFTEFAAKQGQELERALDRLPRSDADKVADEVADERDHSIDELARAVQAVVAKRVGERAVRSVLDELLVSSLSLLRSAGRTLAAVGALPAPASGVVSGLFTSEGGVPKAAVPVVDIDAGGVVGDRQRTRLHHGRPWQALCLWSAEVVAFLAAEGHPIFPGAAGENISVGCLDWVTVRPGARLRLGSQVIVEVSMFALPCTKNAGWFRNGEFMRMHHEREPGISRIYASVLHGGQLRTGDPVELLP